MGISLDKRSRKHNSINATFLVTNTQLAIYTTSSSISGISLFKMQTHRTFSIHINWLLILITDTILLIKGLAIDSLYLSHLQQCMHSYRSIFHMPYLILFPFVSLYLLINHQYLVFPIYLLTKCRLLD